MAREIVLDTETTGFDPKTLTVRGPNVLDDAAGVTSGVGAAMIGLRPVVELMTINFSLLAMDQIVIDSGGSLEGCGTLVADLINNGTVHADCGVKLTINGDVVNNGTFQITNGTDFELNGSFTNAGLLDLLTADVSPAVLQNIVNQGVILDSSKVQVASASRTNGFTVTIQGYAGHNYRLQRSANLADRKSVV